jgi:O-antigen/teichoic acid export membrane protein
MEAYAPLPAGPAFRLDTHAPHYLMNAREMLAPSHFVSHVGSAVAAQGLLSAANFVIGLLLLRSAGTQPYAHYVLAMNTVALVVSLQSAFLIPPLSTRLPSLPATGRAALIGGLLEEQRRLLWLGGGAAVLGSLLYSVYVALEASTGQTLPTSPPLAIPSVLWGSLLVTLCALRREFMRQTLLALRCAHDILRADFGYAIIIILGAIAAGQVATWLAPAVVLLVVALAALGSHELLRRSLHRRFIPPTGRQSGLLQEIIPLALWSTSGAALFWLYTQGFLYLVAANLGTTAVAALAATRLLLMPMNLLSSGLGGLLSPAAASWLGSLGRAGLLRRLAGIAVAMAAVTALWVGLLHYWRDALFSSLFRQPIPHAGSLLLAWGAVYVSMGLRDQLGYLLTALGKYREMTLLTALATITSLASCVAGMAWLPDTRGAMAGILAGEGLTLIGIVTLVVRAVRQPATINRDGIASPA